MHSSAIKPKASSKGDVSPQSSSKDSKLHRRSRQGCYTCRLRRKKCDEKRDVCTACRNLKIECHYNKPSWWTNADKRRLQKEMLKDRIKVTKEKPNQTGTLPPGVNSPPSLCHSVPTTDPYSDFARTRAASIDSHFSPQFDLETPKDFFGSTPAMPPPQWTPMHHQYPQFAPYPGMPPYEVDIKTEREMFINDMPFRKDSTFSIFSSFHESPSLGSAHFDNWIQHEQSEWFTETITEEPSNCDVFEFPHAPTSPAHQTVIEVDEADKYLLEHFLNTVAPLIFPILDLNQQASAQRGAIMPALETNSSYLHCCLSVSALHLRASGQYTPEQEAHIDQSIMDHRWAAIQELCNAMSDQDMESSHMLETMLAMIVFESSVAPTTGELQNVAWHQHLAGAKDIVDRLALMQAPAEPAGKQAPGPLPFNAALVSWIDILGSTMLGRVPVYSESYRQKIEGGVSTGLAELMGCDDRVMYLIAEITCLESLRREERLDDIALCSHITSLGEQLSKTEVGPAEVGDVFSPTGAIRPKQLEHNVTALFRLAARIYLVSLVPGFDRRSPSSLGLVESFANILSYIPAGPHGYDRSLVWPLLIAGSICDQHSTLRALLAERAAALGHAGTIGSFGRLLELLHDVWKVNDNKATRMELVDGVHWREMLGQKGWDVLLV